MKLYLSLAAISILPCAVAMPLNARSKIDEFINKWDAAFTSKPKLNEYHTMADCMADMDRITHTRPMKDVCYNLRNETGAFFYNTGTFVLSGVHVGIACTGVAMTIVGHECLPRDSFQSFVMTGICNDGVCS
ncbi:hypothetical protein P153DRAFT_369934 [Dothidotthia symphoricarpi CBS 119687]|uniref:Uncharacterized protein n=1 Tax=Dothidotthia symphoricarpi CBS 119687 TaxID=1392245 RepID=A0A6A6A4X4_9PLEO|nr:uncharacterized protein P153DRAFT_369934 [Dothidotthia symphoricarpi CBS 119687]KAF2125947.1 hypothetical protein P153DRAFT_369934 [Dothidotthia symphoricarpi CBS 119687]